MEFYSKKIKKEIENLVVDLTKLGRRIEKRQNTLLKEAIKSAKRKGIESEIIDLENPTTELIYPEGSKKIPLYQEGEGTDVDILLKLAQPALPRLYQTYKTEQDEYEKKLDRLNELKTQSE